MASKGVFSLLFLAVAFAQSSPSEVFFSDSLPLILVLFAIAAAFIGVYYAVGKLLENRQYQVIAKTELWQLLLTITIFLTYSSMLLGLQQLLAASLGQGDLYEFVTQKQLFLEKELKDGIAIASSLQYQYIVKGSVRTPFQSFVLHQSLEPPKPNLALASQSIICLPFILIYPQCYGAAILNYVFGALMQFPSLNMATKYQYATYADILDLVISTYARFAETLAIPLRIGFTFLFSDLVAALPLMAVILRLLPFTRQAGNMLFTLSFAFGAVFPFMLAFFYSSFGSFDIVSSFCSEDLSSGGSVSSFFTFGPFSSCDAEIGLAKMISYYPLFIVGPYLSLAVALTFATNFNKLFDYFKR